MLRTEDYSYSLPPELIAQQPAENRDGSRLLVLRRDAKQIQHHNFADFSSLLRSGDLLVVNNSKVLPARLRALKAKSHGQVEILLVEELTANQWRVMLKPGKRVREKTVLEILGSSATATAIRAEIKNKTPDGHYDVQFSGTADVKDELNSLGEVPLPPYVLRPQGTNSGDWERYQTVFAKPPGSVAAPTAGLHFTPEILAQLNSLGIGLAEVTLHVGPGTFAPVKAAVVNQHEMHEERYELSEAAAAQILRTKKNGGRVVAVGTTSLRVIETVAALHGAPTASSGRTKLFVYPPYDFKVVDALLTNFHLPESTLLMLVSAFASPGETSGRDLIMSGYAEAIRERYRFFSYGDAMLIL